MDAEVKILRKYTKAKNMKLSITLVLLSAEFVSKLTLGYLGHFAVD